MRSRSSPAVPGWRRSWPWSARSVVVCLGATAAQALLGKKFKVTQERGKIFAAPLAPRVIATVHPSSILRAPDDETRRVEMRRFVDDLRKVAAAMAATA